MRPTPGESLNAIRRVLQDVVAPQVRDPYAATQLAHMLRALDDLSRRWADEALWLIESNVIVTDLLCDVLAAIKAGTAALPDDLAPALQVALDGDDNAVGPYPTYDQLAARSHVLREALSKVVATGFLERSETSVAQAIRQYLRDHVARLS